MMHETIERVPGFRDLAPGEVRRLQALQDSLLETFHLFGYRRMDVPMVERLELYLRKSGAQVLSSLFSFVDQSKRELALRPEFTASIIRALAGTLSPAAEPTRVCYAGAVFRYDEPARAATGQHTQAGVELLGASGRLADAEILALACRAALKLGLTDLRLVIGHLGPLRALLGHLQVDGYAEGQLLEHLELVHLGQAQQRAVRRRLGLYDPEVAQDDDENLTRSLATAIGEVAVEDARPLVEGILRQMGFTLAGSTRTPDEILERLLAKARFQVSEHGARHRDQLARAVVFTERLAALRGTAVDILPAAEALLREFDVPIDALDELRRILQMLDVFELRGVQVELAPGLARGIAYYSGMIFELFAGGPGEGSHVCGGGRYDILTSALTGRETVPALGFSFSLESALAALPSETSPTAAEQRVCVVIMAPEARRPAHRLAQALRQRGIVAVVEEEPPPTGRAASAEGRAGYSATVLLPAGRIVTAGETEHEHGLSSLLEHVLALADTASIATRQPT